MAVTLRARVWVEIANTEDAEYEAWRHPPCEGVG